MRPSTISIFPVVVVVRVRDGCWLGGMKKLPGSLRKTIEKTSQRLAKEVLHVLHTSKPDNLIDQDVPAPEDETHV